MSKAQGYIFKQVLVAALFIVGTLTAVIWLTQSMRFIKFILNRGLALDTFLELTVLLLPSFLLVTIPVAMFLATIFAFNKMLNDRELVVMRSTGFSDWGLALPVIALGGGATVIGYFISLYLMPVTFQQFRDLQSDIRNNISAGIIQEGAFRSIGRGMTIYVRAREGNSVYGVLLQDDRVASKPVTMMAERGVVVSGETGPRVIMFNGNRQELDTKTGKLSLLYFKRYSFEFAPNQKRKRVWREPNERFLPSLLSPSNSPHDRQHRRTLIAAGHNRLATPLYGLTMPLLALAVMLVGQFNKRGQVVRIVLGIAIAAGIQGLAVAVFGAAGKANELVPLIYANAILPGLIAAYMMARGSRTLLSLPWPFSRTRAVRT